MVFHLSKLCWLFLLQGCHIWRRATVCRSLWSLFNTNGILYSSWVVWWRPGNHSIQLWGHEWQTLARQFEWTNGLERCIHPLQMRFLPNIPHKDIHKWATHCTSTVQWLCMRLGSHFKYLGSDCWKMRCWGNMQSTRGWPLKKAIWDEGRRQQLILQSNLCTVSFTHLLQYLQYFLSSITTHATLIIFFLLCLQLPRNVIMRR